MQTFLNDLGAIFVIVVVFLALASAVFIAGGLSKFNSAFQRFSAGAFVLVALSGIGYASYLHDADQGQYPSQSPTQLDELRQYRDDVQRQLQERQQQEQREQQQSPAPSPTTVAPVPQPVLAI